MIKVGNDQKMLLLQSHRISVVACNNPFASTSWLIESSELPNDFSNYLLNNQHTVFHLLIDITEEESHTEALPAVSARDKKHCIERIRKKHFSDSLLSTTKVRTVKNESTVFVSGVSQSPLCEKLIKKLKATESFVKTIHSPVTLAPQICKQLALGKGAQLLVLRLEEGSFWLVACVGSFVVFNRRVEFIDSAVQDFGGALVGAINETLIYLERCNIVGWNTPKVCLIENDGTDLVLFHKLKDALDVDASLDLNHVLIDEVTENDPTVSVSEGTVRFLASSIGKRMAGYEEKLHKRAYFKQQVRHGCVALALSLFVGAISTAAMAKKVGEQYAVLAEQYDQSAVVARSGIGRNDTENEVSVEAVRQALATAKLAEMRSQDSPSVFLAYLSSVIGRHPTVSIASVTWSRQDSLDVKSLQRVLGMLEPIEKLPIDLVYKATVSGVIQGDPGSALDAFEALVFMLRETSVDSSVVVVEAPFGMSQNARTTVAEIAESDGKFTIDISTAGVVE